MSSYYQSQEVRNEVIRMFHPRISHAFEDEILALIDRQDELTRSDVQGIVSALVNKILEAGQTLPQPNKVAK
jgi:hypothetical protein